MSCALIMAVMMFQCPHGLELLLKDGVSIRFTAVFQCPHGLELLPVQYTLKKLIDKFLCPHGLELLRRVASGDMEGDIVSMPSWA